MKLLDRRDFLLGGASLISVPALIAGGSGLVLGQTRGLSLMSPGTNAQFSVGQTITMGPYIPHTTLFLKIKRLDFKVNGQVVGSTSSRAPQFNWQAPQAGTYVLTFDVVRTDNTIFTSTPTTISVMATPQFEVLYDKLGSAANGWGWAGQTSLSSFFTNGIGTNYFVTTAYLGSVSSPKRLKKLEVAVYGGNTVLGQNWDMTYFFGHMYLGIWNANVASFYSDPLGGSIQRTSLTQPTLGSSTVPYLTVEGDPVYVIGWDNLDIPLPANTPLEFSFQIEGIQLGDFGGIYASQFPGTGMLFASSGPSGNGIWNTPVSARVTASS